MSEGHMDTPIFGDFLDFCDLVVLCPGGSELRPWRFQEVKGSLELQNDGLRALEEAFDDFLLEAFFCQVCSFSVHGASLGGFRRRRAAFLEVPGGDGKPTAPERCLES